MSLRKFRADVSAAHQKAASGAIACIASIANGESDGEVVLTYRLRALGGDVRIQALAQDPSEYPDGNMFMLFNIDDNPSTLVENTIKAVQDYLFGMTVYEMATELSKHLQAAQNQAAGRTDGAEKVAENETDDGGDDDNDDDAGDDDDFDEYASDNEIFGLPSSAPRPSAYVASAHDRKQTLQRIKRDLRQVRQAGYRVGILNNLAHSGDQGIVCISIRISKLALSEEAMEAWDVKETDYIVLLIRFDGPYQPLERVIELAATHTRVSFRIGKCSSYKPSLNQALAAFAEVNRQDTSDATAAQSGDSNPDHDEFQKLFVSNSLDELLNTKFVSLLKYRELGSCSWENANELLLKNQGCTSETRSIVLSDQSDGAEDDDSTQEPHPILVFDHLTKSNPSDQRSFPLVAMQFAMRYFVRCTEFCLRCHRRLEKGFEALRPYVCSDPLCLFQYMAMGFGPSIEHEILTQPKVVDLLVNLCYAAIQPRRVVHHANNTWSEKLPIRTLPVGLRLEVPDLSTSGTPLHASLDRNNNKLFMVGEGKMDDRLLPNRWIAFRRHGQPENINHAIIVEIDNCKKSLGFEIIATSGINWVQGVSQDRTYDSLPTSTSTSLTSGTPIAGKFPTGDTEVFLYDTDFDSLLEREKGAAMRHILDTLPSIDNIRVYLVDHPHTSLRSMGHISPAAAALLQWIVSSNRSCIFQIDDDLERETSGRPPLGRRSRDHKHERIQGMDGWVQFRFAQGSPDKEIRFNRALQEVAARKKTITANPTIFAWHGSAIGNWHSIVRTGLDYTEILSGRAYGNGVYFSPQSSTSIGYAQVSCLGWPQSGLKIGACMSLNEIIYAPDEWVSVKPHFVVAQDDWHQCRYLFVKPERAADAFVPPAPVKSASAKTAGTGFHEHPDDFKIWNDAGQPLKIPLTAIPFRYVDPDANAQWIPTKRAAVRLEDDSGDEDPEDIKFLFSDDEGDAPTTPPHKKAHSRSSSVDVAAIAQDVAERPPTPASMEKSLTDFQPGALDLTKLPRLAPPSFANDFATKALGRELSKMQAVQAKTPLHELGWYMDFDQANNLFQWIVEFHSFDPSLPLAKDMKQMGITSIVLEVRFGKDYPMSPPFVRVIRPRFLPFMNGGGGHVTAGGAMCMELLTNSGWSPANSMESVLLQVRMALCNLEPKPARLESASSLQKGSNFHDYQVGEALEAYIRAARTHGWKVPEDLQTTALGV
ncbi:hypothetical protein B0H63DRAFT_150298 [Podospora didyma]|uniref:UBC core domain-containing protein n=1 Tax=Podospora didyma TaxID=330526 RepID=A0AAE0U1H4_9PEZI|nr:hypothetical protein B0H63DRAFT_150298 [Podospora didyma]